MKLHRDGVAIGSLEAWFPHPQGAGRGRIRRGHEERREVALRWLGGGEGPRVPSEVEALWQGSPEFPELEIGRASPEVELPCPGLPGGPLHAHLVLRAEDAAGPLAVVVEAKGDQPFGDRAGTLLGQARRTGGTGAGALMADRIRWLDAALLPPWQEGLAPLEELRLRLLEGVAAALALAGAMEARRAVFLVHEVVDLGKSSEARRRNNREDLDRFVRRLTGGVVERLQRGVPAGPVPVPPRWGGIQLYLGKVRHDLPSGGAAPWRP